MIVEGPGGVEVEFPDGTDAQTIDGVMRQHFGGGQVAAPSAAPEPAQEQSWGEYARGLGRQLVSNGILMGGGDELKGAVQALPALVDGDRDFWKEQAANTAQIDAEQQQFARENPKASMAATIGGALWTAPVMPVGGLGQAATLGGRIGRSAAIGAGYGAVAGGLSNNENRTAGAIQGGALGAGTGALGEAAFAGAGAAFNRLTGRKPAGAATPAASNTLAADEFGVPLTRGQATGNVKQQAFEEAARNEARGEIAGNTIRGFDARQTEAMRRAEQGIQMEIAGRSVPVETANDAAMRLAEGLRARAAGANQEVNQAYRQARQYPAYVERVAVEELPGRIARSLENENFLVNNTTTPGTRAFLKSLEQDVRGLSGADTSQKSVSGVSVQWIERQRQRINKLWSGAQGTDRPALSAAKRAMDDWTDDVVNLNLMSGDDKAIDAIKQARNLSRDYKRNFGKQGKRDDAGAVLEKILEKDDLTAQELSNLLYAQTKVAAGRSARLAERAKSLLGENSEEWAGVRQGAWLRTIQPSDVKQATPKVIANRITDFVGGEGANLANALFTKEERAKMLRYARVLRTTIPDEGATNPSRTSYGNARLLADAAKGVGAALGFAGGGPAGAAAGFFATKVLSGAASGARAIGATRRAPTASYRSSPVLPASGVTGQQVSPWSGQ